MWNQNEITLESLPRGFHLVTREVLDGVTGLEEVRVGLLHLLIKHTSASLALNENASPDVRRDFETWFTRAVPEGADYWTHTLEGDDDMPAHIKAALLGPTLTLPVRDGAPGARDMAGHIPLRAPRLGRPTDARGHALGRIGCSPCPM